MRQQVQCQNSVLYSENWSKTPHHIFKFKNGKEKLCTKNVLAVKDILKVQSTVLQEKKFKWRFMPYARLWAAQEKYDSHWGGEFAVDRNSFGGCEKKYTFLQTEKFTLFW